MITWGSVKWCCSSSRLRTYGIRICTIRIRTVLSLTVNLNPVITITLWQPSWSCDNCNTVITVVRIVIVQPYRRAAHERTDGRQMAVRSTAATTSVGLKHRPTTNCWKFIFATPTDVRTCRTNTHHPAGVAHRIASSFVLPFFSFTLSLFVSLHFGCRCIVN